MIYSHNAAFSFAIIATFVSGFIAMPRGLDSSGMPEVSVVAPGDSPRRVEYTEVLRKNIVRLRVKKIKAKNMHLKE